MEIIQLQYWLKEKKKVEGEFIFWQEICQNAYLGA